MFKVRLRRYLTLLPPVHTRIARQADSLAVTKASQLVEALLYVAQFMLTLKRQQQSAASQCQCAAAGGGGGRVTVQSALNWKMHSDDVSG